MEGRSPLTIENYRRRLRIFREFLAPLGIEQLGSVDTYSIRLFLLYLRDERRNSPSTINGYYRCLTSFFNWSMREELIRDTPLRNIRPPQIPRTIPHPFSPEDIERMLKFCAGTSLLSLRNRAIVLLFLDTGLRLMELTSMQVGDVDPARRTITVMGKGARERVVRFGHQAERALVIYLSLRTDDHQNMWVTQDGRPLPSEAIRSMVKDLCRLAQVRDAKPGPHTFRHTFGTMALRNGGNIFHIQSLLGHSTLTMTRRYASTVDSEDAIKEHATFSPVDRFLGRKRP